MTEREQAAGCTSVRSRVEAELWGSLSLAPFQSRTGINVDRAGRRPSVHRQGREEAKEKPQEESKKERPVGREKQQETVIPPGSQGKRQHWVPCCWHGGQRRSGPDPGFYHLSHGYPGVCDVTF